MELLSLAPMSILKIKQSSECSENTGSSNARMELTNQEGPECDSSETDGALYCDKCKQRPAHTPTVFSQGQTTPAAMLVSSPGSQDPAPCAAVGVVHGRAPSPQLSIQGFSAGTLWRTHPPGERWWSPPLRRAGRSFMMNPRP